MELFAKIVNGFLDVWQDFEHAPELHMVVAP